MVDLSKCYSKLLKLKVWKALTLRHSRGMSTGSIPVISFFYCLKIKNFLKLGNSKNCLYFQNNKKYNILTVLSNRYPETGGGEHMEIVISFFVTVAAGVTCHLICKWLDRHNKDNK